MTSRRLLAAAGGVLLAAGAIAAAAGALTDPAAAPPSPVAYGPVAAVVVQPAQEITMTGHVTGYGLIEADPNNVLAVTSPFAATVARLSVRSGEAVRQGEALVELTPSPAEALAYKQATTQAAYAHSELARLQQLLHEKLATHAQVAQAATTLSDAEAKLDTLRREGAGQASTTLPAPAAGTIVATSVDAGQVLAQGAPLMTIAPRDALAVLLGVEPESVAAVHPGMAVSLQDALDPMLPLHGTVASVGAALDPRTRLVNVLVRIAAASGTSDPPLVGRFVTGRIDAKAERVVAVLRSAVLRDSQGSYVFIVRKGAAQRVAVTPGLENEAKVAIGTALAAGAPVVVQGNYELQSGMAVREVTP